MLEHALSYAAQGIAVFPCNPSSDKKKGSKAPLVKPEYDDLTKQPIPKTGGLYRATTDAKTIREWWRKWPNAMIGIPTGNASGCIVIDADPRDGEDVEGVISRLEAEIGAIPVTKTSRTPSGGLHLWFRMPDGDPPKNAASRGVKNVDWRSEGGYVIAPPSVMDDGTFYEWVRECDPAPISEGISDLIYRRGKWAPKRATKAPKSDGVMSDDAAVRRYCMGVLDNKVEMVRSAPPGTRNATINECALNVGHYVGAGGLSRSVAYAALYDACLSWGIGADDKALRPGGTLDRALDTGIADPADLSGIGAKARQPERVSFGHDEPPPHDEMPSAPTEEDMVAEYFPTAEPDMVSDREWPFRVLGYNRDLYHYLPDGKGQVVSLKANEHTTLRLLQLADLAFWQSKVHADGKITDEQWMHIANGLMQQCHAEGIFEDTRLRGRGAWIDDKRVIVHTGGEAVIGGNGIALSRIKSRYVYETLPAWKFGYGVPASNRDAHRLVEVCERLTWAQPMSAALLAGWCVVAPICGALEWRPHIWNTGASGSGKTTVQNDIVGRIVGPAAERFDGTATEAGIRQTLGRDARPVLFDEAEGEDQAGVARMQAILSLARVSSSGGVITKGSQNHQARNFVIRSCFFFSSINTAVRHHADESRISKLVLVPNRSPDAGKHYDALMRDINAWFTPEYAAAMFTRTIHHLPVLLENIRTFTSAAAVVFKSRRAADQLGALLAGYYLCHSTGRVTYDKAMEFIRRHEWSDYLAIGDMPDEMRCFQYIMGRMIRVSTNHGSYEVTIGQAIDESRMETSGKGPYTQALAARGIRIDDGMIGISDSAENTRALFRDAPQWASDWRRPLCNLAGAVRSQGGVRFASGINTRATWVPYGYLDGSYREREPGEDS